jgi:hypothetical protein
MAKGVGTCIKVQPCPGGDLEIWNIDNSYVVRRNGADLKRNSFSIDNIEGSTVPVLMATVGWAEGFAAATRGAK